MRAFLLLVSAVVVVALLADCNANLFGRKQKVRVKGTFFCPSDPQKAAGITVKMKDKDRMGIDDNMGEVTTNSDGSFQLEGEQNELTNVDPYLKIYHDCNDGIMPCQRLWKITIPDRYINKGIIDIGALNLEMIMDHEGHDCIH